METALPSRYQDVWLAGGRLPISASPPLDRLLKGVERIASIRAEIATAAKVATMPPVEVVPYIWTRGRALICGRVTALRQGNNAWFGVQLPARQLLFAPTERRCGPFSSTNSPTGFTSPHE